MRCPDKDFLCATRRSGWSRADVISVENPKKWMLSCLYVTDNGLCINLTEIRRAGHVTASVALKRLVGFSGKNRFYRANRDLGRIFKTEFILQYLSEPELRRRIRRGLLKVEQLHALARDVFYGRRGRINARELWEQMNTCSCLNLILACIVYWQACEISRVLKSATRSPMESISPCWNTSAPSSGITLYSTASIFSTESSSAGAVAQKGSSLAYKITGISLVPLFASRLFGDSLPRLDVRVSLRVQIE